MHGIRFLYVDGKMGSNLGKLNRQDADGTKTFLTFEFLRWCCLFIFISLNVHFSFKMKLFDSHLLILTFVSSILCIWTRSNSPGANGHYWVGNGPLIFFIYFSSLPDGDGQPKQQSNDYAIRAWQWRWDLIFGWCGLKDTSIAFVVLYLIST